MNIQKLMDSQLQQFSPSDETKYKQ